MAYIDGNEVLFSAQVNVVEGTGGDVDMTEYYTIYETYNRTEIDAKLNDYIKKTDVEDIIDEKSVWDLIITSEMLQGTSINALLASTSGRVYVNTVGFGTDHIEVPASIKYIEFNPNLTYIDDWGTLSIEGTGNDDDCQIIRGLRVDSEASGGAVAIAKGFKGGVEHLHGTGWDIENCNNISHCTINNLKDCNDISHSTIHKGYLQVNSFVNCTNIEQLVVTDGSESVYFINCKFVKNISGTTYGTTHFNSCEYLENINLSLSEYSHYTDVVEYDENCKFVNPYTCKDYLKDEDIGKVQALTKDGSFATVPNGDEVSY